MFRGFRVLYVRVVRGLSRSGLPDLDYALNPYIGCWHGCIYCYARLYTWLREASINWGSVVGVKINLLEVLEREVRYLRPGVVGVSTITDPYQPIEAIYKLTRRSIELLLKHGFHVSIQTKNTLILRDLDILKQYRDRVDVGFTITTLDNRVAEIIEPKSPPPKTRVEALKKISNNNIETWIFYGPVIPGLNNDRKTIYELLRLARETHSKLYIDKLHIKNFMYNEKHPLNKYIREAKDFNWDRFYNEIEDLCKEYNIECIMGYAEPIETKTSLDQWFKTKEYN